MSIKDENFENFMECMEQKRFDVENKPVQLMFGLTNVCNLHCAFCPYCGFCMSKIEMAHMIPLELIEKLRSYLERAKFVNPSGRGEPLLYKNFEEFISICKECDALNSMLLINNGTQLDKHDISKLSDVNIIGISIDSVDKETFEILRFGAKFEQVLNNIISLRNTLKDTVLQWCVVVNRLNMDQLVDIYEKAREIGINYISFNDVYGYEEDKVISLLRLRESDRSVIEEQFEKIEELNKDNAVVVNNIITWGGFEDGEPWDRSAILQKLHELKSQKPYLDFDKINCEDTDSRRIKIEEKKELPAGEVRLPYCTNPFCVMFIQPDLTVSPCCATYGTIDKIEDNDVEAVWNGENYKMLREAMFNYDMLPDYCRNCEAFSRYDYINDYIAYLKENGKLDYDNLIIPPNYRPYQGLIEDADLHERIEWDKRCYKNGKSEKLEMNSVEYWNNRFSGDWKKCKGEEQTRFFANCVCNLLPKWIKNEITQNNYSICDVGCAEGDALGILHRFFSVPIMGVDFSETAISNGRQKYPGFELLVRDLNSMGDIKTDVVYCSNVLEQFEDPWKAFERLEQVAEKYIILSVPYKEKAYCPEHTYIFDETNILLQGEKFSLIFEDTMDCSEMECSYYQEQQMVLVYARNSIGNLADISQGLLSELIRNAVKEYNEKKQSYKEKLETAEIELQKTKEESQRRIKELEIAEKGLREELEAVRAECDLYKNKLQTEDLRKEVEQLTQKVTFQENLMFLAKNECFRYNSRTIYKIFRAVYRFRDQFMRGTKEDRDNFCKLLWGRIAKKKIPGTGTDGFNPMYNIINILDGVEYGGKSSVERIEDLKEKGMISTNITLDKVTKAALAEKYEKSDIIIFSVINYDFRHQRPQHFASRFAANGHRVFYINANFNAQNKIREIDECLFVVDFFNKRHNAIYETDFNHSMTWLEDNLDKLIRHYAIRDAIVIVDYPNWINGALYLKNKYGYMMVTDYMDDFTGFLGTTTNALKDNCIKLLKECDLVLASSQFLYDIAVKYAEKVKIVRNGTEVGHFYKALEMEYHKERKVIGYYGAVAHWFAYEKVCFLAEHLPECDIVIIGEITEHREKLEKYPNIKLLGEMPYAKLPEHLAYFDVCLIPFDTSTDLIKATNPVKFYEYLSAGKRVVATEIPELEPFKDEFVYMSNDDEEFLEYVRLCLNGEDSLKSKEECIRFAKENDWQSRFETFADNCFATVPKVSIIVLTYNNLDLNKQCIKSIVNNTAYPNYELIIVDNQSTDGTVEYLHEVEAAEDERIKIIYNTQNSGFARGNNIGIQQATGDYILLLNNDTVVTRGWITNMVKHLVQNPQYGMCGAVTNSIGNEAKICVEYKNYTELTEFAFSYTQLHMGHEYCDVDRLAMFCTLISREIIDKCGMLDEQYKVGMFEDDDYAQAVKNQGYKLVIAEDAFVHHVNNASFKKLDEKKYNEIFEQNKKIFEDKWKVSWTFPKYRPGVDWNNNGKV